MDSSHDKLMEARVGKAVRKALVQLLQDIESEPALVIMRDDSQATISEPAVADIRSWLFKRG